MLFKTVTQAEIDAAKNKGATLKVNGGVASEGNQINNGDVITMIIENKDKKFQGDNKYSWFDTDEMEVITLNFDISSDGYTATLRVNLTAAPDGTPNLAVNTIDSTPPKILFKTFTQQDIDVSENNNATLKLNNVNVSVGDVANNGDTITLSIENGLRKFVGETKYSWYDSNEMEVVKKLFTISEDGFTATLIIDQPVSPDGTPELIIETMPHTPSILGSNSVFKIDKDILSEVNKQRFYITSDGQTDTRNDYGNFILSVIEIPFEIPSELIGDESSIKLATLDTGVKAKTLKDDVVKYDLGTIKYDGEHGNLLDYVGVTALLHLPFSEPIALNMEYVLDTELNISYDVNTYTGDAVINVTSKKLGSVVATRTIKIGSEVPYASHQNQTPDNISIGLGSDNGVRTAFLEVVKTSLEVPNGKFTVPVLVEGDLKNRTGFIIVKELQLKSVAMRDEKQEIEMLLKNGVIING